MSSPLCSLHWLHLKAVASEALPLSFFKKPFRSAIRAGRPAGHGRSGCGGNLHLLGCDEIQGYFFSRPVPAEDLRQLLLESGHGSILLTQRVETLGLSS